MKHLVISTAAALLGILPLDPARAACYTVYQGSDPVYRSVQTPVDLSLTLHETVPSRFGVGASMVIVDSGDACAAVDTGRRAGNAATAERRGATPARSRGSNPARYFDTKATPIRTQVGGTP